MVALMMFPPFLALAQALPAPRLSRASTSLLAWVSLLILGCSPSLFAQEEKFKPKLTPTFWQRDPDADFPDEGRMHCAPTSISDGLIYLSRAFHWKDLVPGADHDSQMELITDLAEKFHTDPKIGGTNPDRILTGLRTYVKSKGYAFSRLEVMTWRSISEPNRPFKLGTKPGLTWMRKAANSKDTVVAFNFGWYKSGDDGYTRTGGHWVAVVGAAEDDDKFYVHNPILPAKDQPAKTSVTLTRLDEDFSVIKGDDEANMKGYYTGAGAGLPHGKNIEAVLDAVIVFSLEK
jgi:hypothetical protein